MKHIECPSLRARASPMARRASMQRFERLLDHVLIVGAASLAIAMTAFICVTTKLLG